MNILSLILFHRNCFTIDFPNFSCTQLAEWDYRSLDLIAVLCLWNLEKTIFVKLFAYHNIFPFKSNDIFWYFIIRSWEPYILKIRLIFLFNLFVHFCIILPLPFTMQFQTRSKQRHSNASNESKAMYAFYSTH